MLPLRTLKKRLNLSFVKYTPGSYMLEELLSDNNALIFYSGPSVLEIFNSLLLHLRSSVDQRLSNMGAMTQIAQKQYSDEMLFEEAIIDTIGEE